MRDLYVKDILPSSSPCGLFNAIAKKNRKKIPCSFKKLFTLAPSLLTLSLPHGFICKVRSLLTESSRCFCYFPSSRADLPSQRATHLLPVLPLRSSVDIFFFAFHAQHRRFPFLLSAFVVLLQKKGSAVCGALNSYYLIILLRQRFEECRANLQIPL